MAILYFTNTNDSGEGSLRQTIANASAGDTIRPASDMDDTTIYLESYLPNKSLTLQGSPEQRIVLNGQGVSDLFRIGSASLDMTFEYVDFEECVRSASAPIYASNFNAITFKQCKILNCSGGHSGLLSYTASSAGSIKFVNCVGTGNTGQASIIRGASTSATTIDVQYCTFIGDVSIFANIAEGALTESNSILSDDVTPSSVGFVDVEGEDLRLFVTSEYTTGATGSLAIDILGHERKQDGALGAYEGSWLVVEGYSLELDMDRTCDYIEFQEGTTFSMQGYSLACVREATFETCTISNGYLAIPAGTTTSAITLEDAYLANYGADVSSVTLRKNGDSLTFSVSKVNEVEVTCFDWSEDGSNWNHVDGLSDANPSFPIPSTAENRICIRAFDGDFIESNFVSLAGTGNALKDLFGAQFWKVASVAMDVPCNTEEDAFYAFG